MWIINEDYIKLARLPKTAITQHTQGRYDDEDGCMVRAGCNSTVCVVDTENELIWSEFPTAHFIIRLLLSEVDKDDYIDDAPIDSLLWL